MSEESPPMPSNAASTAPSFFAALGNPVRWELLKLLADGKTMSASQCAMELKRDFDGVSKHLRLMRTAGVIRSQPGEDLRLQMFYVPAENRPEPGILQWGIVRLDLR